MSVVLGGTKFIVHVPMTLVVMLTSVVMLVLLYHCIGILTLVVSVCVHDMASVVMLTSVVSVCVHDGFDSHVDLGGCSVCTCM